jgi:hypothetical protein
MDAIRWVILVARYAAFIFEGTEAEAEQKRVSQARLIQRVCRKRPADPTEDDDNLSACWNHTGFKNPFVYVDCPCPDLNCVADAQHRVDMQRRNERPMTARQIEVLSELAYLHERPHNCHRQAIGSSSQKVETQAWGTTQDCGGTNGSHHSATLVQLAKRGLCDRLKGSLMNNFESKVKGSCLWRITPAGLSMHAKLMEEKKNRREKTS